MNYASRFLLRAPLLSSLRPSIRTARAAPRFAPGAARPKSSTAGDPISLEPSDKVPGLPELPALEPDMLERKALLLSAAQSETYLAPLHERGWTDAPASAEPGAPRALVRSLKFVKEARLAVFAQLLVTYMESAQHHAEVTIMHKRVGVRTHTHRAYARDAPKVARPGLSNKDVQLAYEVERLFERHGGDEEQVLPTSSSSSKPKKDPIEEHAARVGGM